MIDEWRDALASVVIRHPDPTASVFIEFDKRTLILGVANVVHNDSGSRIPRLVISCVTLTFFPGASAARAWIAAAWAGYLAHEALELVTANGARVLDPHAEPYPTNPYNRGVRDSLPEVLTPGTLRQALCVIMSESAADELLAKDRGASTAAV